MDLKEVRFSIKAKSVKVLRTLTDFDGTVLGGPTRTRTWDKPVMSRRLCQLSYRPNTVKYSKKQSPSRRRPVRPNVEAFSARATVFFLLQGFVGAQQRSDIRCRVAPGLFCRSARFCKRVAPWRRVCSQGAAVAARRYNTAQGQSPCAEGPCGLRVLPPLPFQGQSPCAVGP